MKRKYVDIIEESIISKIAKTNNSSLNIYNDTDLTDELLGKLITGLNNNSLIDVDFNSSSLNDSTQIQTISTALRKNSSLRKCSFNYVTFNSTDDAIELISALKTHSNIHSLSFSFTGFENRNKLKQTILDVIQAQKSLFNLHFEATSIGPKHANIMYANNKYLLISGINTSAAIRDEHKNNRIELTQSISDVAHKLYELYPKTIANKSKVNVQDAFAISSKNLSIILTQQPFVKAMIDLNDELSGHLLRLFDSASIESAIAQFYHDVVKFSAEHYSIHHCYWKTAIAEDNNVSYGFADLPLEIQHKIFAEVVLTEHINLQGVTESYE